MNNKTVSEEVTAMLSALPDDKQKEIVRLLQGVVAGLLMSA